MNNTQALLRKFYIPALIIFLTFFFCLPSVVKADDIPPVDPPMEDDLPIPPIDPPLVDDQPIPPIDNSVSNPPTDEWVTWPIEQPGIVRPIKESTGPIHIIVHHKNNTDSDNNSSGYTPEVNYSQFKQPFTALRVNDRSSYAAYNSLVGCNPNIRERIAANIFIGPED